MFIRNWNVLKNFFKAKNRTFQKSPVVDEARKLIELDNMVFDPNKLEKVVTGSF